MSVPFIFAQMVPYHVKLLGFLKHIMCIHISLSLSHIESSSQTHRIYKKDNEGMLLEKLKIDRQSRCVLLATSLEI